MGAFSIWHVLIFLWLTVPALAAIFFPAPKGPNRFGDAPSLRSPRDPDALVFYLSSAFRRMFDWKGRSSRGEFWVYQAVFYPAGALLNLTAEKGGPLAILGLLATIPLVAAAWAVTVRRLHDLNRGAWWLLLGAGFGIFVLWVWCAMPSRSDEQSEV